MPKTILGCRVVGLKGIKKMSNTDLKVYRRKIYKNIAVLESGFICMRECFGLRRGCGTKLREPSNDELKKIKTLAWIKLRCNEEVERRKINTKSN